MIHDPSRQSRRQQQGETRVDDSATGRTRRNTSSKDLIGHGYFRLHQYPRTRRQNKAPLCLRLRFTTWCFQCRQVIILLRLPKCGFLLSGAHPTPPNSPVPDMTLRCRAVTNFTVGEPAFELHSPERLTVILRALGIRVCRFITR
jgi:hypothetical protein